MTHKFGESRRVPVLPGLQNVRTSLRPGSQLPARKKFAPGGDFGVGSKPISIFNERRCRLRHIGEPQSARF